MFDISAALRAGATNSGTAWARSAIAATIAVTSALRNEPAANSAI